MPDTKVPDDFQHVDRTKDFTGKADGWRAYSGVPANMNGGALLDIGD